MRFTRKIKFIKFRSHFFWESPDCTVVNFCYIDVNFCYIDVTNCNVIENVLAHCPFYSYGSTTLSTTNEDSISETRISDNEIGSIEHVFQY